MKKQLQTISIEEDPSLSPLEFVAPIHLPLFGKSSFYVVIVDFYIH